jgi:hypothetical protein
MSAPVTRPGWRSLIAAMLLPTGLLLAGLMLTAGRLAQPAPRSYRLVAAPSADLPYHIQFIPGPPPGPARTAQTSADLDGDGRAEQVSLEAGRARILSAGRAAWGSPPGWDVRQALAADLTGDGRPEAVLLVWRPFRPWPIDAVIPFGGRIDSHQNAAGQSCHLILIGWRRLGTAYGYAEVWAGSALARPLTAIAAGDLDGDGKAELAALEGDYAAAGTRSLAAWQWNGFGFDLLARTAGQAEQLWVVGDRMEGVELLVTGP